MNARRAATFLCTLLCLLFLTAPLACSSNKGDECILYLTDYTAHQGHGEDTSPALQQLIADAQVYKEQGRSVIIDLGNGEYHIYPEHLSAREVFISNHDHVRERKIAFDLSGFKGIKVVGEGARLLFHGRVIPFFIEESSDVTLSGFSIDYPRPALTQIEILEIDSAREDVTVRLLGETHYSIRDNRLVVHGEGFDLTPFVAMPFLKNRHMVPGRADISFDPKEITEVEPHLLRLRGWSETPYLTSGNRYILRTYYRPTPGIVLSDCKDIEVKDVTVHYAEGMGLIAQHSEDILLDGFKVTVPKGSERYFTLQADATHFSGCRGIITSLHGYYEHMADDAINVHGTYLRVDSIMDDRTLRVSFAHEQTFGIPWYEHGDSLTLIDRSSLSPLFSTTIDQMTALDADGVAHLLTLSSPLPDLVTEGSHPLAVENISAYPEVTFSHNTITNNRARGALFSTRKKVVCTDNLFDHTHGSAVLLCGDANGWYESGPCEEVLISGNRFVNALTAMYQFTDGIISISPVIRSESPDSSYYHGKIYIEGNTFETFQTPLYYAHSVRELVFRNNTVVPNNDFLSVTPYGTSRRVKVGRYVDE